MARDELAQAKQNWKHWLIYSTVTFLSIFVFAEFAISVSFLSVLSPSTFMFYLTPVGFWVGEALVSFFATVLVFLGLFVVMRRKVYVKNDEGMEFKRSKTHLLLPFYIIPLTSLGIYISLIPLEYSNILTYAVFLILFESFIEHIQVSDYGKKIDISLKIPETVKNLVPKKFKSTDDTEDLRKTLEELEKITEKHEKKQQEKTMPDGSSISDPEIQDMVKNLMEVVQDGEEEEITIVKECDNCGTAVGEDIKVCPDCGGSFEDEADKEKAIMDLTAIQGVGKTRAEKLYENGLKTPRDIVREGISGLSGVRHIGLQTAKKILKAAKEQVKKEEELPDDLSEELEELENELLDEK